MSIVKDLTNTNIKCYDEDNLIYVPNENILKLVGNNKDLILDIVGKSLNISDNAITLYKVISHSLPRKGDINVIDALDSCNKVLNKSNITSIRAMKELLTAGVVKYIDRDKGIITLHDSYDFTDYLNGNIKYIIIEDVNL